MTAASPLSVLLEAYQEARNKGQGAVLIRKTVNRAENVSLSLTSKPTKLAASPLSLLLDSYQEARKEGQEAVLTRKTENFVETVFLSLNISNTKLSDAPKVIHKSPSTLKRNGQRRQGWLLARNQLLSSPADTSIPQPFSSSPPQPFSSPHLDSSSVPHHLGPPLPLKPCHTLFQRHNISPPTLLLAPHPCLALRPSLVSCQAPHPPLCPLNMPWKSSWSPRCASRS